MSNFKPSITTTVTINAQIDEGAARALDAMVGYGIDPFLEAFYKHLGRAYMQPHERHLRALFQQINEQVRPMLRELDHRRMKERMTHDH